MASSTVSPSSLKFTTKATKFILPKRTWTFENFCFFKTEAFTTSKPLELPVFYAPEHDLQFKVLFCPFLITYPNSNLSHYTAACVHVKRISSSDNGDNDGKKGYWKKGAVIVVHYTIEAIEFVVDTEKKKSKTHFKTFSFQINSSNLWSGNLEFKSFPSENQNFPERSDGKLVLKCSIDVTYQTDSFCGVTCYPSPLTSIEVPRTGGHFEKMKALLETGKDSDLTLVVGDKELKVHKFPLFTHSTVFEAMFSHASTKEAIEKKVIIDDLSAETVRTLLFYLYTGTVENIADLTIELFTAADKYQVDALKEACERRLSMKLTVESVLATFLHADLHSATTLKENCLKFITFHSAEVMSSTSTAWKQFTVSARPELITEVLTRLAAKMSL